ncbi:gluconokinase [Neorhizobium galegae]|uniref:gluconokinase n=1 Tax=Neorhizobium galegae TaxID=399 RepID=UPI001FD91332|nr:gluconokinase [Neorhizobium galegae]MBP2550891.1 gluconokinase [Neorhizobium galegae]
MSTVESQRLSDATQRLVLMGVAGSGKSSVGEALARKIGARYFDGDDLHPKANIEKMSRGEALNDDDRWPWLTLVGEALAKTDGRLIIGCSALKRIYRDHIRAKAEGPVIFVHLSGSRAVISARMGARTGHFMPTTLLDSQFAALEPPAADEHAITVDIDQSLDGVVAQIAARLADWQP